MVWHHAPTYYVSFAQFKKVYEKKRAKEKEDKKGKLCQKSF
jgi:hypothetical protein